MAPKKGKGTVKAANAGVQKKATVKADSTADAKQAKTKAKPEKKENKVEDPSGVVIEACKQCNAFKTRAVKLESLLKEGIEGLEVTINPVKPRKGYFEIRSGDTGEVFLSLPSMQRPFPPLKALDIDEVAQDILGKLKQTKEA